MIPRVSPLSPEGVLLDVNPAFEAMFGYSHASSWASVCRTRTGHRRSGSTLSTACGGIFEGQNLTIETTFMRKDGNASPCCSRPRSSAARPTLTMCIFATIRDISEFKRAPRALEHSAALLNQGELSAHLGSWEWDIASGVHTVSAEWRRIHGLSGEALSPERSR